jgi:putative ABC transport system ATP-binding protein
VNHQTAYENTPGYTEQQSTLNTQNGFALLIGVLVYGVSLSLQPGEFVALVGPSGSGKTTMLAILAGLLRPTSGSIMIDGQELSTIKEKERARFRRHKIGFTFQANNLVPYLTVSENVELMPRSFC